MLPLAPLPSPLPSLHFPRFAYPRLKFTQDRCYSNKARAKLGHCERALGDALEWRLWVGKTPLGVRRRRRSKSDGELFTSSGQAQLDITHSFSTLPALNPSTNSKSTGLRRASTLPLLGYSHDPLMSVPSIPNIAWDSVSPGITSSVSSNYSLPTLSLLH